MVEIKKGREPRKLLQYRMQKNASYKDMPSDIKQEVIEHLLAEQGHLCAYCMKKIESGYGKHRATIEHCTPQAGTTEAERLNYRNMVAVCWGNRDADSNEDKTCDARRGSLPTAEQTMKKVDVFDGRTLSLIAYGSDGTIFSTDTGVDEDLNKRLNLNCESLDLKACRLAALLALQGKIEDRYPAKTAPKEYFQKLLSHYQEQGEYKTPYCGILIAWLKHKLGLSQ